MRRSQTLAVVLGVLAAGAFAAFAQSPPAGAPAGSPRTAAPPAIATIGSRRIDRTEFERRADAAVAEYSGRLTGQVDGAVKDLLRRQVLESLIRLNLLTLEAQRLGVTISPLEAEAQLKRDPFFNPGGKFDDSRFQAVKQQQPAQYAMALNQLREQMAARKLNDRVEAERRPEEADVRARALRGLVKARLMMLPLQSVDFPGGYREPRESDVIEYHRAHAEEYRRPERATLSVAFVNTPSLTDSQRTQASLVAAWDQRMKKTADSLLAAIRSGADFAKATDVLGGPRPNVQVYADNFPGYWAGSAAVNASVFKTKPGAVLEQVVPAREGYLLVRVDEVRPAAVAPLAEVARQVRAKLRADARLHRDENEARRLYPAVRDSMQGPGIRLRYGWTDTSRIAVGEPGASELDRYYRSRLADYSSFDAAAGRITAKPLELVRDDVRRGWTRDRKLEIARTRIDQLLRVWQGGKRDAALESQLNVKELPPTPVGAVLDTTAPARAIGSALWSNENPTLTGSTNWERGMAVWTVTARIERVTPTFEQAFPTLVSEVQRRRNAEDDRGARALFDSSPKRFATGDIMHLSRMQIPTPEIIDVPLTRAEVEQHWREHITEYSAPELVRARHILISPADATPEADAAAKREAEGVLTRLQAGADFGTLVKEHSDDPATKDNGGDLGVFGRGTMLEAFEQAAFGLRFGERSGLVRTEVGYHIIECTEHSPAVVHPLQLAYTNVGTDAAIEKGGRLTEARADSLLRTLRSAADARAVAAKLGYAVDALERPMFQSTPGPFAEQERGLDDLKPGQLDRRVWKLKNRTVMIVWVDSITPPVAPAWEAARAQALQEYRAGAGARTLQAKRAELDSLFASGWSLDSVATLWGGLIEAWPVSPGQGLPRMGGGALVDSLVFGGRRTPVLAVGDVCDWLDLPNGLARFRLVERTDPAREQLSRDMERIRREDLERNLIEYFAGLQARYPVKILDNRLRTVVVPGPPPRR